MTAVTDNSSATKVWAPTINDTMKRHCSFDILTHFESSFKETYFVFDKEFDIKEISSDTLVVLTAALMQFDEYKEVLSELSKHTLNIISLLPLMIHVGDLRDAIYDNGGVPLVYCCNDQIVATSFIANKEEITLTLPVKNEGETIATVIESFLTICTKFVIGVDDLTDDNTRDIIERYQCSRDIVFKFTWDGSFCNARNKCLEKCRTSWIFMTEGHEWLDPGCIFNVPNLNNLPCQVSMVAVKRQLRGFDKITVWPWLTRNNCGVHYRYNSHNAVFCDDKDKSLVVNFFELATIHNRSTDKFLQRKKQRKYLNKKNFLKDLSLNPGDTRALFYLANEYADFGEYDKAIERYSEYLRKSKWAEERYEALLRLSRCYRSTCNEVAAKKTLLRCFLEEVPRNEHMIDLSDMLEDKFPEKAVYYLKMAASVPMHLGSLWISEHSYKEIPWQKLCIIYGREGDLRSALECCRHIKDNWPDVPDVDKIIFQIISVIGEGEKV